jgi:hypothetical protein
MKRKSRKLTNVWLDTSSRNYPQLEGDLLRCVGVFMVRVVNRDRYAESKHFAGIPADNIHYPAKEATVLLLLALRERMLRSVELCLP